MTNTKDIAKDWTPVKISAKIRNTYGDNNCNVAWTWCIDTFNMPGFTKLWVFDSYDTFYFKKPADATMFLLTWGHRDSDNL